MPYQTALTIPLFLWNIFQLSWNLCMALRCTFPSRTTLLPLLVKPPISNPLSSNIQALIPFSSTSATWISLFSVKNDHYAKMANQMSYDICPKRLPIQTAISLKAHTGILSHIVFSQPLPSSSQRKAHIPTVLSPSLASLSFRAPSSKTLVTYCKACYQYPCLAVM